MNREISVFAPAKINLFLEVLSRREDGYHNIRSLMAKIALGDDLKISVQEAKETTISLKVRGPFAKGLKEDKSNLVFKAARGFFEYFGIKADCQIRLEKNIPLSSGLGGGSSDAASVLLALCALFNIELNAKRMKDLVKLAAHLGADIPFFLYPEPMMKAEGIGEKLTPIKNRMKENPFILIANPGVASDTKQAYEKLLLDDKSSNNLTNNVNFDKLLQVVENGLPLKEVHTLLYNDLEKSVFTYLKVVKDLKDRLQNLGADSVLMSGSGASVFALFEDETKAKEVLQKLKAEGNEVFITHLWRA